MEKNKLNSGCMTCRYGNKDLEERPCNICRIKSEESRWVTDEPTKLKGFERVQNELVDVAISFAKKEIDLYIALDWYRQILEQSSTELLDDEDEEDLMDGDLEDQFEKLMK